MLSGTSLNTNEPVESVNVVASTTLSVEFNREIRTTSSSISDVIKAEASLMLFANQKGSQFFFKVGDFSSCRCIFGLNFGELVINLNEITI
jgi:hypothetical protein